MSIRIQNQVINTATPFKIKPTCIALLNNITNEEWEDMVNDILRVIYDPANDVTDFLDSVPVDIPGNLNIQKAAARHLIDTICRQDLPEKVYVLVRDSEVHYTTTTAWHGPAAPAFTRYDDASTYAEEHDLTVSSLATPEHIYANPEHPRGDAWLIPA